MFNSQNSSPLAYSASDANANDILPGDQALTCDLCGHATDWTSFLALTFDEHGQPDVSPTFVLCSECIERGVSEWADYDNQRSLLYQRYGTYTPASIADWWTGTPAKAVNS